MINLEKAFESCLCPYPISSELLELGFVCLGERMIEAKSWLNKNRKEISNKIDILDINEARVFVSPFLDKDVISPEDFSKLGLLEQINYFERGVYFYQYASVLMGYSMYSESESLIRDWFEHLNPEIVSDTKYDNFIDEAVTIQLKEAFKFKLKKETVLDLLNLAEKYKDLSGCGYADLLINNLKFESKRLDIISILKGDSYSSILIPEDQLEFLLEAIAREKDSASGVSRSLLSMSKKLKYHTLEESKLSHIF